MIEAELSFLAVHKHSVYVLWKSHFFNYFRTGPEVFSCLMWSIVILAILIRSLDVTTHDWYLVDCDGGKLDMDAIVFQ